MAVRETADAAAVSASAAPKLAGLALAVGSVLRGKPEAVTLSIACLLARGHLLIEDVPGVGKTTLAQALAGAVACTFHRLQFTADMLPSDVVGVTIYNAHSGEFQFKPGPVFTNFLLADEINRTTPKTQSALLEAMNEHQVTIDGRTHPLPRPFMVVATQNPVEHHGTYPLPESQLDRFLMRIRIGYPARESERDILRSPEPLSVSVMEPVLNADELVLLQSLANRVTVDDSLADYMLAIVGKTRDSENLALGVSPRGAQALYRSCQALALIEGRDYVLPDDIKRLAVPVFGHRVVVSSRVALAQRRSDLGDRIIEDLLQHVDVPL